MTNYQDPMRQMGSERLSWFPQHLQLENSPRDRKIKPRSNWVCWWWSRKRQKIRWFTLFYLIYPLKMGILLPGLSTAHPLWACTSSGCRERRSTVERLAMGGLWADCGRDLQEDSIISGSPGKLKENLHIDTHTQFRTRSAEVRGDLLDLTRWFN